MNEIGIICLLPEEIGTYQRELRQKIAANFGLDGIANPQVPAHVTLKYPFPVENLEVIKQAVQEFSLAQPRTKWLIKGFNYFDTSNDYVIFIDVLPSEAMRKAHASFLEQLKKFEWVKWGAFDHASLHYHVTLGSRGINSENFAPVWSFINQQPSLNIECFFDNLSLVQITAEARSIIKTYWLTSE